MKNHDKTAERMDAVYILTFVIQIAASLAAFVGLAGWAQARTAGWGLWLWIGAVVFIVACSVARWYIKRWFRRQWPIGKA